MKKNFYIFTKSLAGLFVLKLPLLATCNKDHVTGAAPLTTAITEWAEKVEFENC